MSPRYHAPATTQPPNNSNPNGSYDQSPKFEPWKALFYAGTQNLKTFPKKGRRVRTIPQEKSVNKAKIRRILAQPDGWRRIHRHELPSEPRTHEDLDDEFRNAERDHLKSHVPMNSWTEISKFDPEVKGHKILNCICMSIHLTSLVWTRGRLAKCKVHQRLWALAAR